MCLCCSTFRKQILQLKKCPLLSLLTLFTMTSSIVALSCSSLSSPEYGSVDISGGIVYLSEATYSCETGYSLSHTNSRICGANQQWSGTEPTCDGMI